MYRIALPCGRPAQQINPCLPADPGTVPIAWGEEEEVTQCDATVESRPKDGYAAHCSTCRSKLFSSLLLAILLAGLYWTGLDRPGERVRDSDS